MKTNKKNINNKKTGSALLSIILVMTVLSVIGVSIIALTLSNSNQATYLKHFDNAYYDSESSLRLGSDAIRKAATIELEKLRKSGATELSTSFLSDVKTTALTLVPSTVASKLTLTLLDSQIKVDAVGTQNDLSRTTSVTMSLHGDSELYPFSPYLDYSLVVGGGVEFDKKTPSMTTIDMTPQGVIVDGVDVAKNKYRVTNMSENLPPNMLWWDFMQNGLLERFESRPSNYASHEGDLIEINRDVTIRKNSNTIQVGTFSVPTLKNHVIIVNGKITIENNMVFDNDTTTNLMIFATEDVVLDLSASKSTNISDPLFVYSGETFYIKDEKGGGTHELFVYANDFNYTNSSTGQTTTVLNGQYLVKNDFIFDSINGSIKMDVTCVNEYLNTFYAKLNKLADDDVIVNPTYGDTEGLPIGDLFHEGKIIEIPNVN